MKKLLFILLFPAALAAQSGEPVSDTSYFQKQGSVFYEVKTAVYADGSENTTKIPIGDTAALVQATKDRLTSKAATMAVDVRFVSNFRKNITGLLRESDAVAALTGIDPQRAVQQDNQAPFLVTGWTVKRDNQTEPMNFSVNAQGALRYSVGGANATKSALLLGSVVRLKNYPSNGTDTDVYRLPSGLYVNADRTVVLRPPGNDAGENRATTPPKKTTVTKKG